MVGWGVDHSPGRHLDIQLCARSRSVVRGPRQRPCYPRAFALQLPRVCVCVSDCVCLCVCVCRAAASWAQARAFALQLPRVCVCVGRPLPGPRPGFGGPWRVLWGEGCSGGAKEEGGCRHFYFGSPWLLDSVPPHTPREPPARSSPPTPHPPGPARGPWTPARQGPTPEPHGGTQGHQGPASSPKAKWQQPSQCPCRAVPCRAVPVSCRASSLRLPSPPRPRRADPALAPNGRDTRPRAHGPRAQRPLPRPARGAPGRFGAASRTPPVPPRHGGHQGPWPWLPVPDPQGSRFWRSVAPPVSGASRFSRRNSAPGSGGGGG